MQMAADDGNVTVTRIFRRHRAGPELVLNIKDCWNTVPKVEMLSKRAYLFPAYSNGSM